MNIMYLCDDDHEEIVYDTLKCPLCMMLEEVQALKDELQDSKDYTRELEDKLDNAEID